MKYKDGEPGEIITLSVAPCVPGGIGVEGKQGCPHGCIYCFSSCSNNDSTGRSDIISFRNADLVLHQFLETHTPVRIHLGYVSDFLTVDMNVRQRVYEVLLQHNIPISILTKGMPCDMDIDYMRRLGKRLTFMLDVGCGDEKWEPYVPMFEKRLVKIQQLVDICDVNARIDPIIPNVNDTDVYCETVFGQLKSAGICNIDISFLFLTEPVADAVDGVFGEDYLETLYDFYSQHEEELLNGAVPWTGLGEKIDLNDIRYKIDLIPLPSPDWSYRETVLKKFQKIGKKHNITVRLCTCKNKSMKGLTGTCSDARSTPLLELKKKVDSVLNLLWEDYRKSDRKIVKPPDLRRIVLKYIECCAPARTFFLVRKELKPLLNNKLFYKQRVEKDNCGIHWHVYESIFKSE